MMRIVFLVVSKYDGESNYSRKERMPILTVNDRMDEKKVPSSYLDSLDNTPSNTEINYRQFLMSV